MKNLKKVLSLVLALAMALSLMTVAFAKDAADFADYDEINYKEAVDVMVAAGVFNGTGDGSNFDADATLTREQAAKIVTYMLMGKTEADKLVTTVAPYADVAADRWSAGAIAYCTNEGILAGAGNGKFNPTGELTGLAFSKILLTALGYDAAIEKLTGASWAINTAKLAIAADLDENLDDIALSDVLTREQAAQMALNAMVADLVDYENRGTELKLVDGTIVIVGASKAAPVETKKAWGSNVYNEDGADKTVQFAEMYARDLTLNGNAAADKFGRPAHTWEFDNDKIGTYAEEAVLTYTTGIKGIELANDIDDAGYEATGAVDQYRNNNVKNVTYSAEEFAGILAMTDTIPDTGNGVVLEFFADDNDVIDRLVVTATYLGTVTKVVKDNTKTNADERALHVSADSCNLVLTADTTAGFEAVYAAVEADDYVLVTNKGDNSGSTTALTVAIPETVEAAVTKYNEKDGELTIGGEIYEIAKTNAQVSFAVSSDVQTIYLDQYGYVMLADEADDDTDAKVAVPVKHYKSLVDGEIKDMAKVITPDGEVREWVVTNDSANAKLTLGAFYTYTEDDDVYTLGNGADPAFKVSQNVSIKSTDKSMAVGDVAKAYFASDVKFIFVDDEGNYNVKEGVQKIENATYVGAIIDTEDSITYVKTLYVVGKAANTTASSDDVVYVGAKTGTVTAIVDGEAETFYTYDAYINGEEVENFYADKDNYAAGFYKVETDNDTGAYVLTNNAYGASTGDYAVAAYAKVTNVVGDVLSTTVDYAADDAVIVDLTDNDLDSLTAISDAEGDVYVAVMYDADTMVANYIYVVPAVPAT